MADGAGSAAVSGPIAICIIITLICGAFVLITIPSIISTFPPPHIAEVYGAEYICNAVMLKLLYTNSTAKYSNSVVQNSTDLSNAASRQFENVPLQNYAGCLLYNGRAWDAANNSIAVRRRRRQAVTLQAGIYYIGTLAVYRTLRCPRRGDLNTVESSSRASKCVRKATREANALVGGTSGATLKQWTLAGSVYLSLTDTTSTSQTVRIDSALGVPGNIAAALSNNLPGAQGYQNDFLTGCRFARILSLAQILAILNSQVNTAGIDSSTASAG